MLRVPSQFSSNKKMISDFFFFLFSLESISVFFLLKKKSISVLIYKKIIISVLINQSSLKLSQKKSFNLMTLLY